MPVRAVRGDEAGPLRAIRLRALLDAPDSFGSTCDRETGLPWQAWVERAERSARSEADVTFVAEGEGGWSGMAVGQLEPDDPGRAGLFGMWVAPEARGSGLGLALARAVVDWARARGAREIGLWVVASNAAAIRLYRRAGFVESGRRTGLPRDPAVVEIEMVTTL